MWDQRSRNDFSKLMYDELDKREAKLAELEKNPFDNNWKRLSEQEIEKKRREIMENFYGVLDGIKSMPWFKEAQYKHHV